MILPTRDLSFYNFNPKREEYEDQEEYRQRRKLNQLILKTYKKGVVTWYSSHQGTLRNGESAIADTPQE